jgi:hypothetical protein
VLFEVARLSGRVKEEGVFAQESNGETEILQRAPKGGDRGKCLPTDIRVARWHALHFGITQLTSLSALVAKNSACHVNMQSWHALILAGTEPTLSRTAQLQNLCFRLVKIFLTA